MEILGIQIDKPYIRSTLIQRNRKGVELREFKSTYFTEPEDVKKFLENFKGSISTGLSSKDFLIKTLELKIGSHRDLEKAIDFQYDATSHLNPSEMLTIPIVRTRKEGNTEALLFTASREAILSHLSDLKKIDIDPDGISSNCSALCRFIQWKIPSLSNAFIVDLGSSEWTCIWMEEGQLKKSHSISGGIESLFSALLEDRKKILLQKEIKGVAKQIDLLQLKSHLNPHLSDKLSQLRQELAKIIYSFERIADQKPIVFTGLCDSFGHLTDFLLDSVKDVISGEYKNCLSPDEQKYAISLGLALEFSAPQSLQFRRKEFFPKKNWRQLGLYAILLLISSVVLSLGLFSWIRYENKTKKAQMIEFLQVSLEKWDPALKTKIIQEALNEEEVLDRWIQAVESNSKEYSCIPQAPKVAEVLSWLSSHPLVETLKKDGDPLIIREIHYQLVQFPRIGSMQEPYLAKVDLEFQVKGAIHARKFHESLMHGDHRVNPNLEITWEALPDSYRTSFYLKNRSPHVP